MLICPTIYNLNAYCAYKWQRMRSNVPEVTRLLYDKRSNQENDAGLLSSLISYLTEFSFTSYQESSSYFLAHANCIQLNVFECV